MDVFGPFDGVPWAQARWYRDAYARAASGVHGLPAASVGAGDLPLTINGLTVSVGLGRAHVRGAGYERAGTPKDFAIPANTNSTLARIDRLVLRRDLAAKSATLVHLQGTPATTPSAPALSRVENGAWDQRLFAFTVPPASGTVLTGVTDERDWIDPDTGDIAYPRLNVTVNTGWAAVSGHRPQVQRVAPNRARLIGWFSNNGAYTPNGSGTPIRVPDALRPAQSQVYLVPWAGGGQAGSIVCTLRTDGLLSSDIIASGPSIPIGAGHVLDAIEYDLAYTGA